jgi:hypothetical protein
MGEASWGIFEAQNTYQFIELFILSTISLISLYVFVKAYRVISKDQNTILDKMDKIIFILAFAHLGLISIIYLIYSSPFVHFTIRVINLIEEIIMCTVVAYIYFSEERHPFIHKFMLLTIGWAIVIWFFSIMDDRIEWYDLECRGMNSILLSGSCFAVSLVLNMCGWGVLNLIRDSEHKMSISDENIDLMDINRSMMENRKAQLRTFMIACILSSALQFIWDYRKFDETATEAQCLNLVRSHNFFTMFWFIVLKICCTLLPPWGIYYVFYWRNRFYFKNDSQQNLEMTMLNDFDIKRSMMIDSDSNVIDR